MAGRAADRGEASPSPAESDAPRAFAELCARQNLVRRRAVTLAVGPIVLLHIVYFWLSANVALEPARLRWRALSLLAKLAIFVLLALLAALAARAWRSPQVSLGWRASLPAAFAALFVTGTACVASADQVVSTAITPYVTATLGVALVQRLDPRAAVAVYALGLAVLEAGVGALQPIVDARSSAQLNGITTTGIALALSIALTCSFAHAERARRTIEVQSRESDRLRGLLRVCAWCKRVVNEHAASRARPSRLFQPDAPGPFAVTAA